MSVTDMQAEGFVMWSARAVTTVALNVCANAYDEGFAAMCTEGLCLIVSEVQQ
jgi:hypothetical protein